MPEPASIAARQSMAGGLRSRAKREREAASVDRPSWERAYYVKHGYWPTTARRAA